MMRSTIAVVLVLLSGAALAGGPGGNGNGNGPQGGQATAVAGAKAVGVGVGIAAAQGGAGGAINAPVSTGAVSMESNAYSFAGTGLAASANACQGSFSVGPFGGTVSVEFCKRLAIADGMRASGFGPASVQRVLCGIPEVEGSAECAAYRAAAKPEAARVASGCQADPYVARRLGVPACQ